MKVRKYYKLIEVIKDKKVAGNIKDISEKGDKIITMLEQKPDKIFYEEFKNLD